MRAEKYTTFEPKLALKWPSLQNLCVKRRHQKSKSYIREEDV